MSKGRPKITIDINKLIELRKECKGYGYIAKHFGCGVNVVRNRLRELNLLGKANNGGKSNDCRLLASKEIEDGGLTLPPSDNIT